jgi:hypothetical protein
MLLFVQHRDVWKAFIDARTLWIEIVKLLALRAVGVAGEGDGPG